MSTRTRPQQLGVALDRRVELRVEALAAVLEAERNVWWLMPAPKYVTSSTGTPQSPAIISIVPCTEWHRPTTFCCGVPW